MRDCGESMLRVAAAQLKRGSTAMRPTESLLILLACCMQLAPADSLFAVPRSPFILAKPSCARVSRARVWAMAMRPDKAQGQAHMASGVLASIFVSMASLQPLPALALDGIAVQQTVRPVLEQMMPQLAPVLWSVPDAMPQSAAKTTERVALPSNLEGVPSMSYSEFLDVVEQHRVRRVTFSPDCRRIIASTVDGPSFKLDALPEDPTLVDTLTQHDVDIIVLEHRDPRKAVVGMALLFFTFTFLNGFLLLIQGFSPGGGNAQSKPYIASNQTRVTFHDVVGVDGAKEELREIVQFLKEPEIFTSLGARIPRGVLLDGPPGTGKTLLARAVAGEAGVPFFPMSGSEFVEMYVGLGAARVRELFAKAKEVAPCIIFIDEVDAVGASRRDSGSRSDERHNTLNQLLTEMDGFEGNPGIIVLAATNRAEVLDPALLRPGRFDRRITIEMPDCAGRLAILKVHARNKPCNEDVDLSLIARRTTGLTGAALANLINEAAIFAARANATVIEQTHIEEALDRITLGPAKKQAVLTSEHHQRLVAYHEAGHALVAALLPDFDQVAKVSITRRGQAGGLTAVAKSEERVTSGLYSRHFLECQMMVALGGRIAEELEFEVGQVSTGAANDLEKVTSTARMMVTQFGLSEKLGQVVYPESWSRSKAFTNLIDSEVQALIKRSYARAKQLLLDNRQALDAIAGMLLDKETVTAAELEALLVSSVVTLPSLRRDPSFDGYDF